MFVFEILEIYVFVDQKFDNIILLTSYCEWESSITVPGQSFGLRALVHECLHELLRIHGNTQLQGSPEVDFILNFNLLVFNVRVRRALKLWVCTLLEQFLHHQGCLIEHRVLEWSPPLAVNPVGVSLLLQKDVHCLHIVQFHCIEESCLL